MRVCAPSVCFLKREDSGKENEKCILQRNEENEMKKQCREEGLILKTEEEGDR